MLLETIIISVVTTISLFIGKTIYKKFKIRSICCDISECIIQGEIPEKN